jgi:hypothetical protein
MQPRHLLAGGGTNGAFSPNSTAFAGAALQPGQHQFCPLN